MSSEWNGEKTSWGKSILTFLVIMAIIFLVGFIAWITRDPEPTTPVPTPTQTESR